MKKLLIFLNILSIIMFISCGMQKRKITFVSGDLMIGALLPVHEQPNDEGSKRKCGAIRDQYGVQRVEALLYMLDKINNRSNILPGIKLGIEIRDECWDASIALEQAIDFIKETISTSAEDEDDDINFTLNETVFKNKTFELVETMNNNCMSYRNKSKEEEKKKILAVIGPSGSAVAITVQNLLQLFDTPQIGFSATSAALSNKKMYSTFLRVVPSDYLQVQAMIDVVKKMNWTYIFAVYTDGKEILATILEKLITPFDILGSYGQAGMEAFRNETVYLDICLTEYEKIQEYATPNDYEILIKKLNRTQKARVIVCFCYGETVRGLLSAMNKLKLKGRFLILGSDGWSDRIDVAKDYYEEAYGSMSVKAYSPVVKEFHNYFRSLNPTVNKRNQWFEEYWQERFQCYLNEEYKKKFTRDCKSKCPQGFEYLSNSCFFISKERVNWITANNQCKSLHYDANLIDINNQLKIKNILNYFSNNTIYPKRKEFHGLLIENKTPNGNLNMDKCSTIKNEPLSKIACPSVVVLEKDEMYCVNDCEQNINYICSYDTNKKSSDYETSVYSDTLKDYQQDPKMSYVMNSFLAIAYGLDKIHQKLCKGKTGLCDDMKKINGSTLKNFIQETVFKGITDENIYFDESGDPPGRYVILNVQKDKNSPEGYTYKEIGAWDNEKKLNLNTEKLVFPKTTDIENLNFESQCSKPCPFGHIKNLIKGSQKCCWTCKKCEDHAFAVDDFYCKDCDYGEWPGQNSSGCVKLSPGYLLWSEPAALFALFIAFIGIVLNTFICYIFFKYSNTCIVKSTTKELSFIILVGCYLCYLITIPLILKPGIITCYLVRVTPGLSLSLIYGALLIKTNRIYRILSRSKKRILTKKPRFMSLYSQIVLTLIVIAVECGIIVATFILDSQVSIISYPQRNKPRLQCFYNVYTILGPIGYDLFLVSLCTLYAVRTRNLPENFNEAKFIGFSMYTTCVIWTAFIPLYFGSDFKVITLCLSISLSATVILIFLFIPKVYIIIWEPEKNQRSSFATTKDLRIHFGASNPKAKKSCTTDFEKSFSSSYAISSSIAKSEVKTTSSNISKNNNEFVNNNSKNQSIEMKPINSQKEDKVLVSIDNNVLDISEFRHKNEKSCQTSKDLMLQIFEQEIRRRKAYGITESDQMFDILNNINDSFDLTPEVSRQINRGSSIFAKIQNHLIDPEGEKYSKFEDNNESNKYSPRSPTMKNNKMNTPSRIRKSFKEFMIQKKILKDLSKNSDYSSNASKNDSDEIFGSIKNNSEESKVDNSTNSILSNNAEASEDRISNSMSSENDEQLKRIHSQLSKIIESVEDKMSNKSLLTNEENERLLNQENNQNISLECDSSISSSLSNLITNDFYNIEKLDNNFNLIIEETSYNSSDIENEFMFTLDKEDESLEKFKKIFTRDKNLILNWDYAQSSDYL